MKFTAGVNEPGQARQVAVRVDPVQGSCTLLAHRPRRPEPSDGNHASGLHGIFKNAADGNKRQLLLTNANLLVRNGRGEFTHYRHHHDGDGANDDRHDCHYPHHDSFDW